MRGRGMRGRACLEDSAGDESLPMLRGVTGCWIPGMVGGVPGRREVVGKVRWSLGVQRMESVEVAALQGSQGGL